MIAWLQLTDDQRRETLAQAQVRSGIPTKPLEKDWWVTLTLKALFQTSFAQYMVFKGGTSLSKGFNLIERFSEDIDIALDPAAFGIEYKKDPSRGYLSKLRKEGCAFTSTVLLGALKQALTDLGLPDDIVTIEARPVAEDQTDRDPQELYVYYQPLYAPNAYIADHVKIEVSVRSVQMPHVDRPMGSLLYQYFPLSAYAEAPFTIPVIEPKKTFLEKAFLLHEEFSRCYAGSTVGS